jgi:hypothetical protein
MLTGTLITAVGFADWPGKSVTGEYTAILP